MLSKSSEMAVSSRLERVVQCLDEAVRLADSFDVDDDQHSGSDHQETPVFENVVSFTNLPPLDQITICSESCSDNTSVCDVSSVTTDENEELNQFFGSRSTPRKTVSCPNQSLRTIFHQYWEKHRPAPVIAAVSDEAKTEPVSPISKGDESSSINTYERTLQESQEKAKEALVRTPSSPPRRCIFHGLPPTPDLGDDQRTHRYPMKVQSDPCLSAKPPCLRRSRFSVSTTSSSSYSQPEGRRTSSTSSVSTVKFSPKVDIRIYRKPVEHFATKGWSDYFAS